VQAACSWESSAANRSACPAAQRPPRPLQGFEKTGLGERVATLFVKMFGKSTLGLAYGWVWMGCGLLLVPVLPLSGGGGGGG
jgi:hypothetical protein